MNRFNIYHKSGFWSFAFGITVVLLLIAGNVMWLLKGEDLYKRGEHYMPPFHPLFQKMLYTPVALEQGMETDDFFGFDAWGESEEADEEDFYFVNNPIRTASTGREYRFVPEFNKPIRPALTILSAPAGFQAQENYFNWIPEPEQTGTHSLVLGAETKDGTIHTISYELMVSPYHHLMGTDERGRDVAGVIIQGTRWTLLPGLIAALTAILIGVFFGGISGYRPGRVSETIDFSVQILESVPGLLLIFLAAVIFQFNIYWIMVAVGLAFAPVNVKMIRGMVREFVQNQFVESAKELGFKERVVLWRDIVWVNGKASIASQACYCFAFAVLMEVTLSYLNIGVQSSDGISWGALLLQGKNMYTSEQYWLLFFPGISIVTVILGFYLLGDGLGKLLHYRESE